LRFLGFPFDGALVLWNDTWTTTKPKQKINLKSFNKNIRRNDETRLANIQVSIRQWKPLIPINNWKTRKKRRN
jgi:hypothetical protein